jgi:hypothetical protein
VIRGRESPSGTPLVNVLADGRRRTAVAPAPLEAYRHREGARLAVGAIGTRAGVRARGGRASAVVDVVEEIEAHLLPRGNELAVAAAEQLVVLETPDVPVVVRVARVEEGGVGRTVAVVANGVLAALGDRYVCGTGARRCPVSSKLSAPALTIGGEAKELTVDPFGSDLLVLAPLKVSSMPMTNWPLGTNVLTSKPSSTQLTSRPDQTARP